MWNLQAMLFEPACPQAVRSLLVVKTTWIVANMLFVVLLPFLCFSGVFLVCDFRTTLDYPICAGVCLTK